MLRRTLLGATLSALAAPLGARVTHAQGDEEEPRPPRPRVARVRGMAFASPLLVAARAALRPTATALHALRRPDHAYEQRAYVSRRALSATDLALATMRTWGRPAPLDPVWYENALIIAAAPATIASWHAASCPLTPGDGPDTRPAPELTALAAHASALAAVCATGLVVVGTCCGFGDAVGALGHGVAIVDPNTHEVYWSYLRESWDA